MTKTPFPHLLTRLFSVSVCLALNATSLRADTVIVESRTGAGTTVNPPYLENAGNWANSSIKSAAPGTTSTRGGSRFTTSTLTSFTITPTLGTAGGHYFVEVSHATASSISTDVIMSIVTVGGSGLPAATDGFQQTKGVNAWYRIGTVDLDTGVNNPAITFAYSSGTLVAPANRIYADAFRFVNTNDLCLSGLPQLTTVNGPLAAGQTFVIVPAVNAAATNVSVYADGIKIGELNSGVVAGVNTVPTSALVKNQDITATQRSANNIDSCPSSLGPNVGGGANPQIRVALSIRDNSPTGPIGSNGGAGGVHFVYMKATGTAGGGFGNAPVGGTGNVLTPSICWQTLTFTKATDDLFGWAGPYGNSILPDGLACLDSIAFAIEDLTDTGPFQVYIDNVVNGSTIIQDFETSPAGDVASTINQPSFAGSTSPFLLSPAPGTISPNLSTIVNTNADSGANCLLLNWQFKDTAAADWLRATFQGSGVGATPNPIVDLTQPISIRFLVLPVGQKTNSMTLTSVPQSQTVCPGGSASFSVTASGTGTLTYQWKTNGVDITGATSSTFSITGVALSDAATYTVVVTDANCSAESVPAVLTVPGVPTAFNVTGGGAYCAGASGAAIGLDGSESGVAYLLQTNGTFNGVTVAGTGSAISFGNQPVEATYSVLASNTICGGAGAMNGTVSVTITPGPAAFTVTGGGAYCPGGAGFAVGLSGSQSGVDYLLRTNGIYAGVTVPGTGSAISFGNQTTVATYTVLASDTTTTCTTTMTGSASVTFLPLPGAIAISMSGTDVVLNWAGNFTLQSSLNVAGTYADVAPPVTTGPYTNTASTATRFFRLKQICP